MHIVCLTHVPFEGPALIAEWAGARGHTLAAHALYDERSPHPSDADMVVVMGGPMSIYDERDHPFLAEEKRYLARVVESDALVLGVCLGAQLVADVCGGRVTRADHTEIGWYPVRSTVQGAHHGVFGVLPAEFSPLHWHGDTFSIPPGAEHLAASEACVHQAFSVDGGRIMGLQFHLECTPDSLGTLIEHAQSDLADEGPWISSAEAMLEGPARFTRSRELAYGFLDAMASVRARG